MTSGLLSVCLSLWLQSAAGPGALGALLDRAADDLGLPVSFADPSKDGLTLGFHDREYWSRAWFSATEAPGRGVLYLSSTHYVRGLGLREVREMQPDTTEYLFHALLEARLALELDRGGELGEEILRRGGSSMASLPPEVRKEAYVDALASFGSHLLSLYGEIARKERSRRARDGSLCGALDRGAPLFRLWDAAFSPRNGFPGSYTLVSPTGRGATETRWSSRGPDVADRVWFSREILGTSWTGEASVDLRSLVCQDLGP